MIDITDHTDHDLFERADDLAKYHGRKVMINPKYVVEISQHNSKFFCLRMAYQVLAHLITVDDATKVADAVRRYNDAV